MDRPTAFNTLAQDFKTWMTANYPSIPVQFPDLDFQPPESPNPWVRWTMEWSGSVSAGAGNLEDRHTGMIFVDLFYPVAGFKDVNETAEAICDHYRSYSADGGRLQCKGINDGQRPWTATPPREAGWIRRTVNVPVRLMEAL